MEIKEIINFLEYLAPPQFQENYDNCGLISGDSNWACSGVLITLDCTESVILEAKSKGCNLVVTHHPTIFSALKKISPKDYVGKTIIAAIKNDIAIFVIHTSLDNVLHGVNGKIAEIIGLEKTRILEPKVGILKKMYTFMPTAYVKKISEALFEAGAGNIGDYSEVGFTVNGTGGFKPGENARPFIGNIGERHNEPETKLEVIYPQHLENRILAALIKNHPYEEVAYDLVALGNVDSKIGAGLIGELPEPIPEKDFLQMLKEKFCLKVIKHTSFLNKPIKNVALCGGAGSFLINRARAAGADIFVSSDIKYHEFFDANNQIIIADIGHFESEQFTINLLFDILQKKYTNFAVLKAVTRTNPLNYFI
jgi:dinuclear metal center YbgI/SA1388 family protein